MTLNKAQKHKLLFIFDDIVMMSALVVNLFLIGFDWFFSFETIQSLLDRHVHGFYLQYSHYIHSKFTLIDWGFVVFYLLEFFISWMLSVKNRWYERWYYYPTIHWYDLLGCVPVGSMRFFRVLRVFSITIRLHKLGVIDLRKTTAFERIKKLYDILLEEVADRIVIKVLDAVQQEIQHSEVVIDRVLNEVVRAHQARFAEWLSCRFSESLANGYQKRKEDINGFIRDIIGDAFRKNEQVELMKNIPMVGKRLAEVLEASISDIVFRIIDNGVNDIDREKCEHIIKITLDTALDTIDAEQDKEDIKLATKRVLIDLIEIIKDQVRIQKWKQNGLLTRKTHKV